MSGALAITGFLSNLSSDYSLVVSNNGSISRYHLLYLGKDDVLPSLLFTVDQESGLLRPGPMINSKHYSVMNKALRALIADRSMPTWIYFTNKFFLDSAILEGINITGDVEVSGRRPGSVNKMHVIGFDMAVSAINAATTVEGLRINLVHIAGS